MNYVYETHLHTVEASACGRTPGADYIEHMKSLGYSGIIVTDHFFNGNSCVPKNLPWEQRVELYCKGYEAALEASKGQDFTVMFGIEYNFQGDEYLLYGVGKEWLLSHPDIMEKSRPEVKGLVHEGGGIMIQAHPFRERDYLNTIHLMASVCDGAEVFNAANQDYQNALAYEYAVERGLMMTAGSDIHSISQNDMGGISFPYRISSIDEFVKALLAGDGTPVYKKDARNSDIFLPVAECEAFTTPHQNPFLDVVDHDIKD